MQVTDIKLLQKSKTLQLHFANGDEFSLPCAYLRAHSPSAENKHKPVSINEHVNIIGIDPVGNYAVKLIFDDGHDSGIYSWKTLHQLAIDYKE